MSEDVSLGLRLRVPFWCGFRDPFSSNVHRTLPVPPPTTLYGLAAAALGLPPEEDYSYCSLRKKMRFAVAIEKPGELIQTYSKWMKATESPKGNDQRLAREDLRRQGILTEDESLWTSTPLVRQKWMKPVYVVGILCSIELAERLETAFKDPYFPLCLGESDDFVDIEILEIEKPQQIKESPATGIIGGVHPGGVIASLPWQFSMDKRSKWHLKRWLVTVPNKDKPIPVSSPDLMRSHGQTWTYEPRFQSDEL